ncbi:MAG: hypothetical protein KID00_03700 [Clostridium argentinense]|uniref:Uncharacterized protein n=1 Tax=Clostridium faecium TaxID=2762223 RepID=A0ABR8YQ91_9CLOT|nr:hypothetical protein [Clostridium faecium]MBD8046074.1 hypothetical protein [Clostridium faecium]MBS5822958.1 hypothetical protein [Clostridium argentinense]MDU1349748.1 hypothetical protein [Clostridium argentinense]
MSENNKNTSAVSTDKKNTTNPTNTTNSTNAINKNIEKRNGDNCGKIVVYTDTVNININCCK